MRFCILCLLIVSATAARPYKYRSLEYKPVKRYSEKYFPVYFKSPDRIRGSEERKPQEVSRPVLQQEVEEGKVGYGKVSKGGQKGKEFANSFDYPISIERKGVFTSEYYYNEDHGEKDVKDTQEDAKDEEEVYEEDYDNGTNEEDEDEHGEFEHEDYHEDEEMEEEETESANDYGFEHDYKDDEWNGEEYEDEHDMEYTNLEEAKKEEEGAEEAYNGSMSTDVEKNTQTMPLKGAEQIFAFPGCDGIVCSKAGLDGYGCSDAKCKFVCSKTECYEYPEGPPNIEEITEQEEVEEVKVGEEEESEVVERDGEEEEEEDESMIEVTTTTTTTPEPETLPPRKEGRRRKGRSGRGKIGRGYKL
ncbi:unnamed protein product [Hydatigera taeniaeformis]|uniref:WAP domain-containing protein n=1 Tax=Hydatigena taeniaeformis TaxID=6205 RepID=A0A0R3X501_HYDTA|nr:unnamed protein product [Hydatigera taeniaeformis]